jgi:hypothetical protein
MQIKNNFHRYQLLLARAIPLDKRQDSGIKDERSFVTDRTRKEGAS